MSRCFCSARGHTPVFLIANKALLLLLLLLLLQGSGSVLYAFELT
jgi:hypothetical protein